MALQAGLLARVQSLAGPGCRPYVYRRRNAEMHGDVAQAGPSRLLDGATTSDLHALVGDFERLLRRAAHLFLIQTAGGDGGRTA